MRFINYLLLAVLLTGFGNVFGQPSSQDALELKTFSTKNHPKAKGVHLTINYPSLLVASESNLPNIVQQFHIAGDGVRTQSGILIKPLPSNTTVTELDEATIEELKDATLRVKGTTFIEGKKTTINGFPTYMIEFWLDRNHAGMDIIMRTIIYNIFYGSFLVQFNGSVQAMKTPTSRRDLSYRMKNEKLLFTAMASSIFFPERPEIINSEDAYILSWIENYGFLVGIVALILVGLGPAMLIRYVFVRRPWSRKSASWIYGFYLFVLNVLERKQMEETDADLGLGPNVFPIS